MAARLANDDSFAKAVALLDQILPDARRLEKPSRTGLMVMVRAIARPYTAHSPARAEFEEALAVTRDAGDPLTLGYILAHCGFLLCIDGDTAGARALHEETLNIACPSGMRTCALKRTTTWLWTPCQPTTPHQLNPIWLPRCVSTAPSTISTA